jgi:hypothetical protein
MQSTTRTRHALFKIEQTYQERLVSVAHMTSKKADIASSIPCPPAVPVAAKSASSARVSPAMNPTATADSMRGKRLAGMSVFLYLGRRVNG